MTIFLILLSLALILATAFLTFKMLECRSCKAMLMKEHAVYEKEIAKIKNQLEDRVSTLDAMVEKLTYANQELNRINDLKSKFVSIVAHDLKQPLTSIQGYANFLKETREDGDDQKMLDVIVKSADNMNELMSDLIDASLLSSENIRLHKKEFDYIQLLDEVYRQYKIVTEQKHLSFIKPENKDPIIIHADKTRIHQVLSNLISNAIKFTPEGGAIEIKYEIEDKKIKTIIKDNGMGIAQEEQIKIFEKFHQVAEEDADHHKVGWGLGLPISYDIVRAHSGDIGVKSPGLGQGAEFWFTIPLLH